jgi:peptide/nickel transport system permease protein
VNEKMINQKQYTGKVTVKAMPKSGFRRIIRIMASRPVVVFGAAIMFMFLILSAFGTFIAPFNPNAQDLSNFLKQPTLTHLLGTDAFGRDALSRLIYGARISLMVGVVAVTISGFIGMFLGLLAGYFGRWTDNIIMRVIDTLMALPPIALVLAIAAALGGGLLNVMIALGIGMIPTYCRLMYGQVRTLKESDYVTAAHVSGASDLRIMIRHILPNAFPPLLVLITLNMGTAILMEATLSFLGIGISPPTATWGSMINDGYRYLFNNPVLSIAPGVAIALVVLSFNLVGDGLRDALDPRLRGTL